MPSSEGSRWPPPGRRAPIRPRGLDRSTSWGHPPRHHRGWRVPARARRGALAAELPALRRCGGSGQYPDGASAWCSLDLREKDGRFSRWVSFDHTPAGTDANLWSCVKEVLQRVRWPGSANGPVEVLLVFLDPKAPAQSRPRQVEAVALKVRVIEAQDWGIDGATVERGQPARWRDPGKLPAGLLSVLGSPSGEVPAARSPAVPEPAWVTADVLWMRGAPAAGAPKVARVPQGAKVEVAERREPELTVAGRRGRWVRVRADIGSRFVGNQLNEEGWVFDAFLTREPMPFSGMHLPPAPRLWGLANARYNNEQPTALLELLQQQGGVLPSSLQKVQRATPDEALAQRIDERLKRGGVEAESTEVYPLEGLGTLVIVNGTYRGKSVLDLRPGQRGSCIFLDRQETLHDVILFPSFEYAETVAVRLVRFGTPPAGAVAEVEFGEGNEPYGRAWLTLMNGFPHLRFTYVQVESGGEEDEAAE